jgi:hypothetical protein
MVAWLAGVSLRHVHKEIERGALQARKTGHATLILRADLRAWLNALPHRSRALEPRAGLAQAEVTGS